MKTVTKPLPVLPYHIALADVVYQDVVNSPSPIFSSIALWNGLASLAQRGGTKQHLEEFLDRVFSRLNTPSTPRTVPQIRFGQSFDKTLKSVQEASQIVNNYEAPPTPPAIDEAAPFKFILEQIEIAKRVVQSMEAQQ